MKTVQVKVIPRASRRRVEELGEDELKVWVHSPPEKGKANQEVRKLLAEHFSISPRKIRLTKGEHSRKKTFTLDIPRDSRKIGHRY